MLTLYRKKAGNVLVCTCAFIPEAKNYLAGLLTCSCYPGAFPSAIQPTVAKYAGDLKEFTAAGTVRDFHPVPYYLFTRKNEQNQNQDKGMQKNRRLFNTMRIYLNTGVLITKE